MTARRLDTEVGGLTAVLACPSAAARVLAQLLDAAPEAVAVERLCVIGAAPGREPMSPHSIAVQISRARTALDRLGRPGVIETCDRAWRYVGDVASLRADVARRLAQLRQAATFVATPPPAARERNPADVSADAALRKAVRDGRARRVSWANLSKMTGKCEADLRRLGQTLGIA